MEYWAKMSLESMAYLKEARACLAIWFWYMKLLCVILFAGAKVNRISNISQTMDQIFCSEFFYEEVCCNFI